MSKQNKWTQVTLKIYGDAVQPEKVSALLNVKPSGMYKKGQQISDDPRYAKHATNGWYWEVPCEDYLEAADQLDLLFNKLSQKKAEISNLLNQPGVKGDVFLGSGNSEVGQCTVNMGSEMLQKMSQFRLNLCLDFYP